MRKAKIYIPTQSAMQSGKNKSKKWILEYKGQKEDTPGDACKKSDAIFIY